MKLMVMVMMGVSVIMARMMVMRMLMCDGVSVRGVGLVSASVDLGGGVRILTPASTTAPIPVLTRASGQEDSVKHQRPANTTTA